MRLAFLREADWLHAARARAYGIMLAIGIYVSLSYHWLSLALGHHPGAASIDPGKPGPTDFLSFWAAGRLALQGQVAAAWNLAILGPREHAAAAMDPGATLAFFYPPTFLLICLPFAALPYLAGFVGFVAAQGVALLAVLRRIAPAEWGWLPLLAFPGLLLNAATGQNGFISAACLGVPLLLLERAPWLAGAALGGLVFKPHLAVCVPVALLAARRWRALLGAAASALILAGLAWAVLGSAAYGAFLASLPAVRDALENHPEDWGKLQSAFTAARLCGAPLTLAYGVHAVVGISVLAWVGVTCRRRPGAAAEGAVLASAAMLCSPHVLDYDLAVTGVPLAWLARQASRTGWLPWEKICAGLAFVWPLVARVVTQGGHLPLGPVVLLGLFWVVCRRAGMGTA